MPSSYRGVRPLPPSGDRSKAVIVMVIVRLLARSMSPDPSTERVATGSLERQMKDECWGGLEQDGPRLALCIKLN